MPSETLKQPKWLDRVQAAAFRPVDGMSVAAFRIVFGLAMSIYAIKAMAVGEVRGIYVEPVHHFSYWGFEWVQPWPGVGMFVHFLALAVFAAMMAAGLVYRFSALATALLFTFAFLCDRTAYLNHMYLMMLLSWLMVILPADRVLSMDRWRMADGAEDSREAEVIPRWSLWLVQFHVGIPYFFGGVAKLNADWLQGQPMRMTLSQQSWFESIAAQVGSESVVMLFAWGGTLLDLAIVPMLLWRRTRWLAFFAAVVFHLTNAFVFPIGVFPWLMIGATTIFFAPDWPRRILPLLRLKAISVPEESPGRNTSFSQRLLLGALAAYVLLHCVLPLRHLVIPGNPSWTERGHFFAWHMMLRGKRCGLRMYVVDRANGETTPVDLRKYVTRYQYSKVSRDPEHIRQLAHKIAADFDHPVEVRAFALVSLNGRKPELLVDPQQDLSSAEASWTFPTWIASLDNPLLKQHWDVPLLEWETALGISGDALVGKGGRSKNGTTRSLDSTSQAGENAGKRSAVHQSDGHLPTGARRG